PLLGEIYSKQTRKSLNFTALIPANEMPPLKKRMEIQYELYKKKSLQPPLMTNQLKSMKIVLIRNKFF
ncbi:MAG: hypothetical protein L0M06_17255, partial [Enterococcus sp.]|uniref:hypothetical protein n=1 Tax=Enterococcus sp. TaxID=35783 RepID=UPI0026498905